MTNAKLREFIEKNTVSCDISYRGGTLKVDVSELFDTGEESAIMGAYQNYLGGGMAGAIQTGRQFDISGFNKKELKLYDKMAEELKKYFYNANNGGGDDYMQSINGYAKNQKLPASAY